VKVESYRKKISGPILDRIDLHVEMKPLSIEEKFGDTLSANSQRLSEQVREAREMQRERFAGTSITYNAAIPGGELSKWCVFEPEAFNRYRSAIAHGMYSTRATDRMAKIARTIADLDRSGKIDEKHIDEAAGFLRDSPLARG
jgi:magnesium chelatase family protein